MNVVIFELDEKLMIGSGRHHDGYGSGPLLGEV